MANETPRSGGKQRRADRLAEPLRPGPGLLERAQHVDRSATGARITPGNAPLMVTIAEQERKVANPRTPNRLRILFSEPFNQVSVILEGFLGLTGMGGLVVERISHSFPGRPVMFLLNVTIEAPRFVFGQAAVYRIPVQDDEKEDLSIYFDEATEKLEQVRRDGLGVAVVNCLVGISRSATIVLAYLIRYQNMSLEGAFRHVKAARPVITPNLAFLNQLAAYELKCRNGAKEQCSLWNEHTHQNGITRRLPAFILAHFLEDYDHLFDMP